MAKNLVIVESPAKAKTINKFLGRNYLVKASMGHVRDLPKSKLGVDIEDHFKPHYITIRSRSKILKELKRMAGSAQHIYLAADPDREGEAISWHLKHELQTDKNQVHRVMFNEITKKTVLEAIQTPLDINQNMVNAQQARRILDRLVGYSISPLLWKKVRKGLSAGRVQSVTVRLVVNREREIEAFEPKEYWKIDVLLETEGKEGLLAHVTHVGDQKIDINNGTDAQAVVETLKTAQYRVINIEKKEQKRKPPAPFITSKLQQEAASKLHFTAKKTMMVAQQLYEGLEIGQEGPVGLITYMRTDSMRVNEEAQAQTRSTIQEQYGQDYLPAKPPVYKSKKQIQDAHEAIRPSLPVADYAPDSLKKYLSHDQYRLYKLIWQRFLASQMTPAVFDATTVDIEAGHVRLRTNGSILKFKGFTTVYTEAQAEGQEEQGEDNRLPDLRQEQPLFLVEIKPEQKFTQPPPRYNDASLVKALEENNIGRPSTYAPIISTILDRDYVQRRENRFYPTELGMIINDLLVEHFPDILDVEFTAAMENRLDSIEEGQAQWDQVLNHFYGPFKQELDKAQEGMKNIKSHVEVELEQRCEKCGSPLTVKWGRHGKFIACTNYPACKNTKPMAVDEQGKIVVKEEDTVEGTCEKCGSPLVAKYGRFGRFLACSRYPECKYTKAINKEIGMTCPKPGCGGQIIERRSRKGRLFYGCSHYPKCEFVSWDRPLPQACPVCGHAWLVEKYSKKTGKSIQCPAEGCDYKQVLNQESTPEGQEA